MDFHAGDTVMHWTHGLGKVIRRERRDVLGTRALYYAIQVGEMTIWVPVDDNVRKRLRRTTPRVRFKRALTLLAKPAEMLPTDRHERKLLLSEYLKDSRVESLVRIIRCLLDYRKQRSLNENDQAVMHRVQSTLVEEWGYVMDVTPGEARIQLMQLIETAAA